MNAEQGGEYYPSSGNSKYIPTSFDFHAERVCRNCNSKFYGRFCPVCGEKVVISEDKRFRNQLGQVINAITFLDNKIFRTLKLIFFDSGRYSLEIMSGRTIPYLKPVPLFFMANLFYFLFSPATTYNSTLNIQMNALPHSQLVRQMVQGKIESSDITMNEFRTRYEPQSTNMAKLLLIVFVFFVTFPFALLFQGKERFFSDHFVVSLEFNTIILLFANIFIPWVSIYFKQDHTDLISLLLTSLILFKVIHTVYQQSWIISLLKTAFFIPMMLGCLMLYRMILFFVTFWTI